MYYLELIQRFWKLNDRVPIGTTSTAMYLFLLKTAFENERYDFSISDVAISKALTLTRKTVKVSKDKLKNLQLINYTIKKGLPCRYRLLLNYPLPEIDTHLDMANTESLIKESYSEIIDDNSLSSPVPAVLILPVTSKQDIQEAVHSNVYTTDIPDIDEFLEYVETLEMYESALEPLVREKYEAWVKNDWKNNFHRPITNWKSSLKNALPFIIELSEHHISIDIIPDIKHPKLSSKNDKRDSDV